MKEIIASLIAAIVKAAIEAFGRRADNARARADAQDSAVLQAEVKTQQAINEIIDAQRHEADSVPGVRAAVSHGLRERARAAASAKAGDQN